MDVHKGREEYLKLRVQRSSSTTYHEQHPNHLASNTVTTIFPNYDQRDATFLDLFISTDALHVSGRSSAHHQEHKTEHTASGIVNQYCC